MAPITLFGFQQEAVDKLINGAVDYYEKGPDRIGGRTIPYVSQLKAVTGAGKTPILASVISRLPPSIILWTTKFGSVVDQTATNLKPGGKYYHLFDNGPVEILKLGDIQSFPEWQEIIEKDHGTTILISTVAAWNSTEKDDRLNVHRVNPDWGLKSRWDQLRIDRKRPLWIVYDEAHNQTTEQVEQLDELEPAGFFIASASPVKGKLLQYLSNLPDDLRRARIIPVSTRAVVDAQLLKSTISISDYDSSADEMIADAVKLQKELSSKVSSFNAPFRPKIIYVVESSNLTEKGLDPRPVAIWKTLVNQCGIPASHIAVCTNTRNLPKEVIKIQQIENLSDQYTHIIFNKKLQEGWDDPAVYVCYFDGRTDSGVRIQQVIGRALRQPQSSHFSDEDLNTAFFFVHCPNERLDKIVDELKEELRIYKDEEDSLEGFEPFNIVEQKKAMPKIPVKPEYVDKLKAPQLQLELSNSDVLKTIIERKTYSFGEEERSAPGRALVNTVSVRTGQVGQRTWDLLEDMRVRCGAYLQDQIRILSKNCLNSIHPDTFTNEKLDKTACYKSKALDHYHEVALEVVAEYENQVQLAPLADPYECDYYIRQYQPSGNIPRSFEHAAHPHYDNKAFNPDELEVAKALDTFSDYVWVRNKQKIDYGIPMPIRSSSSSTFYPDFIWWVKNTVWAIDPTGDIFLNEKLRTKLLIVPPPLKIALLTKGKFDANYKPVDDEGWTLVYYKNVMIKPEPYDDIKKLLAKLVLVS